MPVIGQRTHLVLLAAWTLLWFAVVEPHGGFSWHYLRTGGELIYGGAGGGLNLYAHHPELQMGPVSFLVAGLFNPFPERTGQLLAAALMSFLGLVILVLVGRSAAAHLLGTGTNHQRLRQRVLVAGLAFIPMWIEVSVRFGHLDDVLALFFTTLAVHALTRGRAGRLGASRGKGAGAVEGGGVRTWASEGDAAGAEGLGGSRGDAAGVFRRGVGRAGASGGNAGGVFRRGAGRAGASGGDAVGAFKRDAVRAGAFKRDAVKASAFRGSAVMTGAFLALALDSKPTALAFLPLLLALPRRDWLRAFLVCVALVAVAWLPFFIGAPHSYAAAQFTIPVQPASPLRWLGVGAPDTPPWGRPAQAVLGLALGCFAVSRGRWPAVVLLGANARIALDPSVYTYYTASVLLGTLLWDTIGQRRLIPWWTWIGLLTLYAPVLTIPDDSTRGLLRLGFVVVSTVYVLFRPLRRRTQRGRGRGKREPAASASAGKP
ncbi:hypothetical protein ABZX85_50165 [Streptomyces sp. NPDC004539]|uniref:hypothetical protein n=1 Tax=Streptomyces sp. NPDC004539 TaxID=3154280 RepID=UPI0033A47E7C